MSRSPSHHPDQGIIRLRLRDLAQLFNLMDPSPFPDRDLDANAEEFIVSWARELPPTNTLRLVIHLSTPPADDRAAAVQTAVQNYFSDRAENKRREFRQLMRRGRRSLGVGLAFLAVCLAIGNLIETHGTSTWAGILNESFIIVGWVAMWRPLEIYLYDWWPLRAEWRLLQKLSRVKVELAPSPDGGPAATSR